MHRRENGEVVHRSAGHTGSCEEVAWAPDGRRIATCSLDRTVRIWDAATGTELVRFPCGDSPVSLAWSPNGRRLVCALRDGIIRIWASAEMEAPPSDAAHLPTGVLAQVPPFDQQPESTYERLPLDKEYLFSSEALALVEQSLDGSSNGAEAAKLLASVAADEELFAELAGRRPHDPQLPIAMALRLASLERWEEAEQQLDKALSIVDDNPHNNEYLAKRSQVVAEVFRRAWQQHVAGESAEAVRLYRSAADVLTELSRRTPDDQRLQLDLARGQLALAAVLPRTEELLEQRIEVLDSAVTILQSLVVAEPENGGYRHELGRSWGTLAGVLWAVDPVRAEDCYRQAIDQYTQALSLYSDGENTLGTRSSLRFAHWGLMNPERDA